LEGNIAILVNEAIVDSLGPQVLNGGDPFISLRDAPSSEYELSPAFLVLVLLFPSAGAYLKELRKQRLTLKSRVFIFVSAGTQ
jgi:hypothetical protein